MANDYNITKIVQKDLELFELFLEKNDESNPKSEQIEVQAQVLSQLGILKPTAISQEQYIFLLEKKQYYLAYGKALNYLSYRKRSIEEVRKFLIGKEVFTQKIINDVLEKLLEQNYLNDLEFALSYVNTALNTTLKGPQKIREELMNYGCDSEILIQSVECKIKKALEIERLNLLATKQKRKKYVSSQAFLQKFEEKAYKLGYHMDVISLVKKELSLEDVIVDTNKIAKFLARDYQKIKKKKSSEAEIKFQLKQKLIAKKIAFDDAEDYVVTFLLEQLEQKNE